jgi:hypothetical protein
MKKSKKIFTRIIQNTLKKYFPTFFLKYFLFLRTFKKFKKIINKSKNLKLFSDKNLNKINKYEFKLTSQNNEDGIIDYIFKVVPNNKYFCEIGFGFYENNSLNLIKNGWSGRLVDADPLEALALKANLSFFYPKANVKILNEFVNKKNINNLVFGDQISKKIDFFSLDVDGNDYWLLKELNLTNVSVICCEYNHWLGIDKKISMKYDPHLNFNFLDNGIFGASLLAINEILNSKKFHLIAVESSGTNAFFVNEEYKKNFEIISPKNSYQSVGRFYSKKRKEEIFNNVSSSKLLLEV